MTRSGKRTSRIDARAVSPRRSRSAMTSSAELRRVLQKDRSTASSARRRAGASLDAPQRLITLSPDAALPSIMRIAVTEGNSCATDTSECAHRRRARARRALPHAHRPPRRPGRRARAGDRSLSAGRRRRHDRRASCSPSSARCGASSSSSTTAAAPAARSPRRSAAKADPDGYTILYDATAFSVNPSLYPQAVVRLRQGFPAGVPGLAGAEHPGGEHRRSRRRPSPT